MTLSMHPLQKVRRGGWQSERGRYDHGKISAPKGARYRLADHQGVDERGDNAESGTPCDAESGRKNGKRYRSRKSGYLALSTKNAKRPDHLKQCIGCECLPETNCQPNGKPRGHEADNSRYAANDQPSG
jgi:hypothetical protein